MTQLALTIIIVHHIGNFATIYTRINLTLIMKFFFFEINAILIYMKKNYITKAPKRSKSEILRDRERITEMLLMGYTQKEIQKDINDTGGHNLSIQTISNDVKAIRTSWQKRALENYEELMNQEIDRINAMEKEVWRAWRASCRDSERETVEKIAREIDDTDGEEFELVVKKVTTMVDKSGGVGDPRFLDKIITLQEERRKLLGLYAPTRLGIDINKKSEIVVKGYAVKDVSPDVWPDVIDGEVIDPKQIVDGK